ncbi:hypothetical protein [Blautia sp.]|nr:hypothetical protein [uncultured Blautia sp.]
MCLSESRKSESFALAKEQKVLEKLVDILAEENQITLAERVDLKERIKKYGGALRCGR